MESESSNIRLIVFDILGKEAAVLVNDNLNAGIYEVTFDASNLSSGIYFYKLTCHGQRNYTDTKRMILLK